ncbi:MAG: DMT family transporter [Anaerotardibacter sp.]
MNNKKAWIQIFIAIAFELVATTSLKLSEGFTVLPYSIVVIVGYAICFAVFTKCLEHMSLALAYGIWGGIGTVGTIIIGMVVWHEPFTIFMGLGVLCVIAGTAFMAVGEEEALKEEALHKEALSE